MQILSFPSEPEALSLQPLDQDSRLTLTIGDLWCQNKNCTTCLPILQGKGRFELEISFSTPFCSSSSSPPASESHDPINQELSGILPLLYNLPPSETPSHSISPNSNVLTIPSPNLASPNSASLIYFGAPYRIPVWGDSKRFMLHPNGICNGDGSYGCLAGGGEAKSSLGGVSGDMHSFSAIRQNSTISDESAIHAWIKKHLRLLPID